MPSSHFTGYEQYSFYSATSSTAAHLRSNSLWLTSISEGTPVHRGRSRRRWDRDEGGGPGLSVEGGAAGGAVVDLSLLGFGFVGEFGCGGWVKIEGLIPVETWVLDVVGG
ncbi:hypothetical protein EV1_027448 [Malus domestica]